MKKDSGQKGKKIAYTMCVVSEGFTRDCTKEVTDLRGKSGEWRSRDENCPNQMVTEKSETVKPAERKLKGTETK